VSRACLFNHAATFVGQFSKQHSTIFGVINATNQIIFLKTVY